MFEKVNPSHPDKVADRIAGAIVDYAYKQSKRPRIAVEVLIGHGQAQIISETSVHIPTEVVHSIVERIAGDLYVAYDENKQDRHLADNQDKIIRCGDNGIFKGVPVTREQHKLSGLVRDIYTKLPTDGKYIIDGDNLIACQSYVFDDDLKELLPKDMWVKVNPLGYWTGGINVDTGATNRKLGSDMGDAVTGGGLHGKDLSKADVAVNIYAHLKAQETGETVNMCCAIGDKEVNGIPYAEIVKVAKNYINLIGGFEKLAEWGLV